MVVISFVLSNERIAMKYFSTSLGMLVLRFPPHNLPALKSVVFRSVAAKLAKIKRYRGDHLQRGEYKCRVIRSIARQQEVEVKILNPSKDNDAVLYAINVSICHDQCCSSMLRYAMLPC